jgi:hypothetical protein
MASENYEEIALQPARRFGYRAYAGWIGDLIRVQQQQRHSLQAGKGSKGRCKLPRESANNPNQE